MSWKTLQDLKNEAETFHYHDPKDRLTFEILLFIAARLDEIERNITFIREHT